MIYILDFCYFTITYIFFETIMQCYYLQHDSIFFLLDCVLESF